LIVDGTPVSNLLTSVPLPTQDVPRVPPSTIHDAPLNGVVPPVLPSTMHNAPFNAGERLQFLYLQKEVKILRKQLHSLTSSLEVALEKLKDKLPCCSEELVKVNLQLRAYHFRYWIYVIESL